VATENKRSNTEEEYFKREDAERIRKLHAEELARLQQHERETLRKTHAGRCANCGALMVPEKAGEVDVLHCPACGGAFLDRKAWEFMHGHEQPQSVMGSVLNWFKTAHKP
jgi:hypothetical protein